MIPYEIQKKILRVLLTVLGVVIFAMAFYFMLPLLEPEERVYKENIEGKKNPEKYLKKVSESVSKSME
jgi:uncharacterized membrane protein YgaE (UPF0421/DUF939 family)